MEVEKEIPSHFLCPISMQLMKDPVTISTGITYDKANIERWLFTCRKSTCPVTKQALCDNIDLTPNHTLRRLIQSWCTMNSIHGLDPISSPKKPVDKSQIIKLLNDAKRYPPKQIIKYLKSMRSIIQASDDESKIMCMDGSGLVEFLTMIILKEYDDGLVNEVSDEALTVLHHIQCTDSQLRKLSQQNESAFFNALLHVTRYGSVQSLSYAITLLRSLFKVMEPTQIASASPQLFNEIVRILKKGVSDQQTIKLSLELVVDIVRWGRNRIKAAESGMVSVLVELLIDSTDRRGCELMLVALEQICRCAEGRAKLVEHAAGPAIVSKKILRVSHLASDRAVRILCLVCRFSASCRVVEEMVEVGVVSKLCLMIQVECNERTKERVKQILTLHSRVWKDASCVPFHLLSSYPSL